MAAKKVKKARKSIRSKRFSPTPIDWEHRLGNAVRTRRRILKLTQLELASLARCGPAFLHQLEHGKQTLQLDKVISVLHVLGLQLAVETGQERLVTR